MTDPSSFHLNISYGILTSVLLLSIGDDLTIV